MSKFICNKCKTGFNRKAHLIQHLNRKFPCIIDIIKNPLIELCVDVNTIIKNSEKNNIVKNDFICKLCDKTFSTKFNLERHLNGRCKKKMLDNIIKDNVIKDNVIKDNVIKDNIIKDNIIKDNIIKDNIIKDNDKQNHYDNELNNIKHQLNELKKDNEKLKKQINKKKQANVNIINNNIINNNIVNNNQNIVNFNNMNYKNIDKKLFTDPIMNTLLFGKEIILKMIENIYINEDHPEYQNIVVTDKNRGYVKIYNNGKWKTNNIHTINTVIDGIIEHSKTILYELYNIYSNNLQIKGRLNTSEKYVNLCDLEFLADLEEEQENDDINNEEKIQRCKDFRDMIFKDTINLFHDNKNIIIKPKKIK